MDENKSSTAAAAAAMGSGGGEMNKVFNRFDEDGDGKISAAELGKVVRALGSEVSEREVEVMIQEMDSDRDGFVDRKEFAEFNKSGGSGGGGGGGGGKGKRLEGELRDAFDMYDLNKNGVISAKELHLVLQKLGEKCRVEDCSRMIKSVDSDGDGCVNFEEFKMMMSGGLKKKKEQT